MPSSWGDSWKGAPTITPLFSGWGSSWGNAWSSRTATTNDSWGVSWGVEETTPTPQPASTSGYGGGRVIQPRPKRATVNAGEDSMMFDMV